MSISMAASATIIISLSEVKLQSPLFCDIAGGISVSNIAVREGEDIRAPLSFNARIIYTYYRPGVNKNGEHAMLISAHFDDKAY